MDCEIDMIRISVSCLDLHLFFLKAAVVPYSLYNERQAIISVCIPAKYVTHYQACFLEWDIPFQIRRKVRISSDNN